MFMWSDILSGEVLVSQQLALKFVVASVQQTVHAHKILLQTG